MVTGVCALCLNSGLLLASHFLPAALYKNLRDPTGVIKNPVLSNLETASEESRQLSQALLCQECEIRFQQGGENWVLGKRLLPNNSFLLPEILQRHPPAGTKDGASFYEANRIPEIRPDQLLYFAASVFWRAAVADWSTPLGRYGRLGLAPEITEDLRKFLLGQQPFSSAIAILLMLSASSRPLQAVTLPAHNSAEKDWRLFEFYIPGMIFVMAIGNNSLLSISLSSVPHVIAVDPKVDARVGGAGSQHAARSTATKNLKTKIR